MNTTPFCPQSPHGLSAMGRGNRTWWEVLVLRAPSGVYALQPQCCHSIQQQLQRVHRGVGSTAWGGWQYTWSTVLSSPPDRYAGTRPSRPLRHTGSRVSQHGLDGGLQERGGARWSPKGSGRSDQPKGGQPLRSQGAHISKTRTRG